MTRVAWLSALAAVALGTLPTALALLAPPPGLAGFGTVVFVNDFAQYEAAMNEAARSPSWLVHNHFTPEPHAPAWMFPIYAAIGKAGALLGTGWELPYRLLEVGSRLTLAVALASFGSRFAHPRYRGIGIGLALFGAGVAFWAVLLQASVGVTQPYVGNSSYEVNTFTLFLGSPHAALGLAAVLTGVAKLVEAESSWKPRDAVVLAACVLALGLLHAFSLLPVVAAAVALAGLAAWERHRSPTTGPWSLAPFSAAAVVGAVAVPFVLYHGVVFGRDPFWNATYSAQNVLPSPAVWELPVDLGAMALGLVGLGPAWRMGGMVRRLAVVTAVMFLSMYAPVPFQRRLGLGVAPLLAVLTTYALAWLGRGEAGADQDASPLLRRTSFVVLLAAVSTPLVVYGGMLWSVRADGPMAVYRATADLATARDWLTRNSSPTDVVLASWDAANYLAGAIPGRTAGGHPVAVLSVHERRNAAARLFTDAPGQEAVLRAERARYLVSTGPHEPALVPSAQLVYRQGDVAVFRVRAVERGD